MQTLAPPSRKGQAHPQEVFITDLMRPPEEVTYAWLGAITKVEKDPADPSVRYVYGKATDETVDSDDQIVDPDWARKAMADWFSTAANVRQMHSTSLAPAGKGVVLDSTPGGEFVRTKVVEPTAITLVDHEVYTGYSVGIAHPRIIRDSRARGGRIVGGRIVELSLVDRPANPMAKFQVATKRAADGGVEFTGKVMTATTVKQFSHSHLHMGPGNKPHKHPHTHGAGTGEHDELYEGGAHAHSHAEEVVTDDQTVASEDVQAGAEEAAEAVTGEPEPAEEAHKGDEAECTKCHGTGKVDDADCTACGGSGILTKTAEAETAKTDEPAADEPKADLSPQELRKMAKTAKRVKKSDGPPAEVTEDEPVAVAAEDEAAGEEAEEAATEDKHEKGEVPWLVRRAHDLTCGAYQTADVLDVYPSIEKNGVAAAVGDPLRKTLHALLLHEIVEDAGNGADAFALKCLAKAYWCIEEFLKSETDDAVYLAARGDLHAAFKMANGLGGDAEASVAGLPKPSETITPGQFHRPYLTEGHQREAAAATPARIPTDTHPVEGSDFTRGPLTEGHQRTLSSKLAEFHDALSEWHPELCLMDANGSMAFDRQPPNPVTTQLDNRAGATPTPIDLPPAVAVPAGEPSIKALTPDDIEGIVTKVTEPLITKIATLEQSYGTLKQEYEELASSPDPAKIAHRGVRAGGSQPAVTKVQSGSARKRAEKVAFMQSLAHSTDAEHRQHAQDWLARKGIETD